MSVNFFLLKKRKEICLQIRKLMKPQEKLISLPINFFISQENHNDNILYIVKAG